MKQFLAVLTHKIDNFFIQTPWLAMIRAYGIIAGGVRFSLNGTTYQNNSLVTLEDIVEHDTTLLCMTNLSACCRPPYTNRSGLGNWYFPNTTRVKIHNWDIYRTRGQMVVYMHRRRGGENGIYRCEIHDSMNVRQNIYIGVYSAGTGE